MTMPQVVDVQQGTHDRLLCRIKNSARASVVGKLRLNDIDSPKIGWNSKNLRVTHKTLDETAQHTVSPGVHTRVTLPPSDCARSSLMCLFAWAYLRLTGTRAHACGECGGTDAYVPTYTCTATSFGNSSAPSAPST